MPYAPGSGQATATFLSIKRTQGLAAAKAWGRKHRKELGAENHKRGKHHKKHGRPTGYMSRSARNA